MAVSIITQFRTKPGSAGKLIELIKSVLPESLDHDGCIEIHIRQNQEDPNDIISVQQWTSRHHYESYRQWRAANGVTAAIREFLEEPIAVRYFDDVPMGGTDEPPIKAVEFEDVKAPEVPKVGSTDAPGG